MAAVLEPKGNYISAICLAIESKKRDQFYAAVAAARQNLGASTFDRVMSYEIPRNLTLSGLVTYDQYKATLRGAS
jgi:hypothetical protein